MSEIGIVCATDLDRTLIYSRAFAKSGTAALVAVERHEDRDASWMAAAAAQEYAALHERALVVPATTRTVEQWRRVRLPGPPARFAVAANGGVLLAEDRVDRSWQRRVSGALAGVAPLARVWRHAARVCRPEWTRSLRNADDFFCYAVLDRPALPAGFVATEQAWASEHGWQVSLQGRKLYWVPRPLTKSAAVHEIAHRSGIATVVAAGDSLLDADLLAGADAGIAARHGELVASGWRASHVEVTAGCGLDAGAEIVRWLSTRAAGGAGPTGPRRD